jgi:hypothetical protein
MSRDRSYLREVERYFLSIIGSGVMLSSRDYDLIKEWETREIPIDALCRALGRAVEEYRSSREGRLPKSLYHCLSEVEEELKEYYRSSKRHIVDPKTRSQVLVAEILDHLASVISKESNRELRKLYSEIRERVYSFVEMDEASIYQNVERLEKELYERFFDSLDSDLKGDILSQAESMIHLGGRYMTHEAYHESLIFYRNKILGERFGIEKVLGDL